MITARHTGIAIVGLLAALPACLISATGDATAAAPADPKPKDAPPPAAKSEKPAKAAKTPKTKKPAEPELPFPPKLPDGRTVVTFTGEDFLKAPAGLREGVSVAKAAPTVDFAFLPGQDYAAKIWSVWGDSVAAGGKYYTSFGDHNAPAGDAFVYEYDPAAKTFRRIGEIAKTLSMPEGHYVPGKIHSRLDVGEDGKIYFSTHRGSTTVTSDKYHYKGDWIMRADPATGKTEVLTCGPVPKHCIPNGLLDGKRMIFYGGTAPGTGGEEEGVMFFAWDVKAGKLLYSGPDGPPRYMALAKSTGRIYYTPDKSGFGPLVRFDPASPAAPVKLDATIGMRAATEESPDGKIIAVSAGRKGVDPVLYSLDTRTEKVEELGPAPVGTAGYIASLDSDPTGRYVYYIPGAHGGAEVDGSPLIQFDVKNRTRKVVAFLHPAIKEKVGVTLRGTYSTAVDPAGDKVYVTWNAARRYGKAWDCVALTVIHIPESERGK